MSDKQRRARGFKRAIEYILLHDPEVIAPVNRLASLRNIPPGTLAVNILREVLPRMIAEAEKGVNKNLNVTPA